MDLALLGRLSSWLFVFLSLGKDKVQNRKACAKVFGYSNSAIRGRVWVFILKHAASWWKTLFSFCASDAAKLSPGFISKRKEAAKIAILML